MTVNIKLLGKAIVLAIERHAGQIRRETKDPYVTHPLRVFSLLALKYNIKNQVILIASILHDVLEDTNTTYDELVSLFGNYVANLVKYVTKDKSLPYKQREAKFLEEFKYAPIDAVIVKLADMYDNIGESRNLPTNERKKIYEKVKNTIAVINYRLVLTRHLKKGKQTSNSIKITSALLKDVKIAFMAELNDLQNR